MARMTQNQKQVAAAFRKSGFSRHDSKVYAQNTSQFMFQTGVSYVSGVLTAATVGAARIAGKGIGWTVGKAADGVREGIAKHREKKAAQAQTTEESKAPTLMQKIDAIKEKKAQQKAGAIVQEILEDAEQVVSEQVVSEMETSSGADTAVTASADSTAAE